MTKPEKENNKYYEATGFHTTRYFAQKAATNGDVAVKVDHGYTTMPYSNYQIWINQK